MCYFLYGSLYGDIDEAEYESVQRRYGCRIPLGTRHDVKTAVRDAGETVRDDFRVTDGVCDCDSPVGGHDPAHPMILELSSLIGELSALPGAKQIYICKTWTGKQNKKEIALKLNETDLPALLADLRENCLYSLSV